MNATTAPIDPTAVQDLAIDEPLATALSVLLHERYGDALSDVVFADVVEECIDAIRAGLVATIAAAPE